MLFLQVGCVFADRVTTNERKLYVNNEPYLIKGICYNPVQKGERQRSFQNLTNDLELMKEAGINTIRVYSPINEKAILDEINEAGIKVILGFGYNQNGNFDILSGSFIDYIKTYKDHGAILFWELGNEYNYHPEWFEGEIENWYSAMNEAAALIHKTDPDHPVATAHGELPDAKARSMSPNIDIWGMNVYRWDDPSEIFSQWARLSNKPMYLAEAGADSYMTVEKDGFKKGSNEGAQAMAVENILNSVFNHTDICLGVTLFSFSDEWWKAGNINTQDPGGWAPNSSGVPYDGSPNEEYWGIVDVDRNKKEVFGVVETKFNALTK
jgi:beta-galactosidase/beta-glucuronidase